MYIWIMINTISIQVSPEISENQDLLKKEVSIQESIELDKINHIQIIKRSIDARQKKIKINLKIDIYINQNFKKNNPIKTLYQNVKNKKEIIIIGAGPAGLFAALELIKNGKKPIILERGKNIRERRRDLVKITREHTVNENSNYCFGEGGAGTFSDGKLYTRAKKRGDINNILDILIENGANPNIKVNTHPHIGTNKLPKIIESIRNTIIKYGGEIIFNSKVTNINTKKNSIYSIEIENKNIIKTSKIILATGHSARDIFNILYNKNIDLELKPFAIGVRIEHTQKLIDKIQYKTDKRNKYLPPASYSIVKQINGRGVYSFCMCPGGVIAPCATKNNEIVTNGWSPSQRNYPTSNSGIVVELKKEDFRKYSEYGPLAGVEFQKEIEKKAYIMVGKTQKAPAQRLLDFLNNKISKDLPKTSYLPGIVSVNINELLPGFITKHLKDGFREFGKKMNGFLTNDAIIHAPETRTSSPIKIPRNPLTLEHTKIKGLYPCGEGAGYAGGIMSAAIDGIKCARKC